MDASQYKDYVLALLFIKYVGVPFAPITIPEGASFKDMVDLKNKPDIGDQINKITTKSRQWTIDTSPDHIVKASRDVKADPKFLSNTLLLSGFKRF